MKNNFLSKSVPRGTRTIWRYLSALILLFSLSIGQMWADEIFGFTCTSSTTAVSSGGYTATGGTATLSGSAMATGGSNEMTVGTQTFYKFNSSSQWTFTLSSGKFAVGDVISFTCASNASSDKSGKGVKINNSIAVTGDFPKGETNTISYTVVASDGVAGQSSFYIKRNDSDIKFGSVSVTRASSDPVPVSSITIDNVVDDAEFYVGDVVTFETTVEPSDATNKTLSWEVDDPSMGTITDAGVLTITAAGDFTVTASATDESGVSASVHLLVYAAPEVCPSGLAISGTAAYTEGQTISLSASLAAGNGDITYNWYKGADFATAKAAGSIGTGASFSKASCETGDAGYYWCEATKDECAAAHNGTEFVVSVDPLVACAELVPATSGDAPVAGDAINLTTATGGSMQALSANLTYTANGLQFGTNSGTKASVTLNHLMQETTVISVTLVANGTGARGLKLYDAAGSNQVSSLGWSSATNGEEKTFTYTVTGTDKLNGTNGFQLWRNNTVTLKSLKVFNCGAELFALNSAIYPAEAEGKATITLSKNFVENGGTATATYSDIDAAYDFDEWVISGATIDDEKANPVTITMGSNPATITLKLKDAGTKYPVHFDSKGGSAVDDQLVDEGGHAAVPTAPTKFKYTFGGWSETDGGAAADLASVAITAEKTFYAIWTPKACPTSGTIYSFVSDGTKAPGSNTYCPASGVQGVVDIAAYATVSGGLAQGVHTTTSNNPIQIQTSTSAVKLSHADGYFRALLECPLQIGDTIKFGKTNKVKMAFDSLRTKVVEIASGTGANKDYYIVPTAYAGEDTIMIYYGGSSVNLTSLQVIRPAHFAVTFNMHDHGDAVDPQSITEGGKVTKPADPTASGWDFGGWFKESTYDNEWDFDNDVVNAATEIHAKWTEHTTSHDATLKSLSYTIGGGDPIAIPLVTDQYAYAVELPMGTDIDAPVIAAVANDPNAKEVEIVQTNLGVATVTVTAEDNSTIQSYAITFSVATSKDINLVWATGTAPCKGTPDMSTQIKSNNAAVSTYINQITFTNVEGAGDDGAEGSSLNVGKKAGNMFTLTAKPGYALAQMHFLAKIQDATCEYSIDGSDWTELASANTGGNECYAPFTSGTVHEFRLRSTGAEGVWIRNMQLNIIEACTPIVVAWDEEPVEFEVGKAGYAIAATANNSGTITYASADNTIIDVNASTGALTIAGLGSVALSASIPEGDGSTYCANGGDPIVLNKTVNTYYLVTFDGQNGEPADEVKYFSGDAAIALPATDPTFAGYDFQGWFDAATGGNKITSAITPTASITVYAQWVAQCDGATITTQPVGTSYLTGRTATALVCEATAGAGGALTYEWFTCDDDQKTNPVAASATPSTAVAGTFYYFCKVTEAGCDKETFSNVVTITVTDKDPICLAWVDVTANNTVVVDALKSLYAPEVSASNVKNTSSYGGKTGYKFNSSPAYIAIEGAPFKSGDIVEMFVTTTTADVMRVYKANTANDANQIGVGTANVALGVNKVALSEDANNLYLRRGDDHSGWNPSVAYVAVYRACAPILNKVTVNGVEGAPVGNVVTIEVPFTTTQSQLEAIAFDWVSNDDAWTAAHTPVATNAWAFGVANTVTLTDKDGDESVYYVTVNKAAASANVELATLTVNGNAVPVVAGQAVYSYELPYGTSAVPVVVATAADANANVSDVTADITSATFTVTAEDGTTTRDYTINFSISKWAEVVIWDGSYMSAVTTSPDATTGFAWTVNGFSSITNYNATCGTKAYTKTLPSGGSASDSRNVAFTVPAGYVAKFYIAFGTHSDGSNRGMFIASNAVKKLEDAESVVLTLYSDSRTNLTDGTSEIVGAGTYYLDPMESVDFYEIRAYLRPGYGRTAMLGNGVLGTVCVDHNVAVEDIQGVSVYELVGRDYSNYGKLAFDEIVTGELEAGAPYVFQAHGDRMVLFYGETKVSEPVDNHNGMYGTFTDQTLYDLNDVYYFAQRALWSCVDLTSLSVPANRAYVKLSEVDEVPSPTPAPGRRRILLSVNGENQTQGVDNLESGDAPVKVMIDGTLYIIRGEKVFDATGHLVK